MLYFAKWKIVAIVAICLLGVIYAAPNMFRSATAPTDDLPFYIPYKTVNLGLDLQGGSHLLLRVDTDHVVSERVEGLTDLLRNALREARVQRRDQRRVDAGIEFQLVEPERGAEVRRLIEREDPELTVTVDGQGRVMVAFTEDAIEEMRRSAVEQSIDIVRRRIDEMGTREPNIQREGTDRIIVQLPGVDNPERVIDLLGQTARLSFHLLDQTTTVGQAREAGIPPGSQIMPGLEGAREFSPSEYLVRTRIIVGGEHLVDAQPTFQDNQPVVSFRFDSVGAQRFGRATQENVGRPLAIVLDGKVISAPVIREPILGGRGQISGSFSVQETHDLSLLLRAGALPAPLVALETRTVGPGLGQDSIDAGKLASVIGLVLVVVFMIAIYGLFGVMAVVALFFNMALILAALSILQATLTLPGIAGIILTIGMAVDANVLIFERIREELNLGRTPISGVEAGYQRALTTIIDANVTTFIAALILFFLGSGPIRGFAVTLAIGLVTSMFTAIWVTRLMVVVWLRQRRRQIIPI